MDKEVLLIFSAVFVVAFAGLLTNLMSTDAKIVNDYSVNSESLVANEGDDYSYDAVTGEFSCRKCKRAIRKVTKEVARVDDNIKKAADKVAAEAGRFGKRIDAERQRFDDRVINEVERYGNRVEDEFNRIDDNLKEWKDKAGAEIKRARENLKKEIDAQTSTLKNVAQGRVCDAYNSAQQSAVFKEQVDRFVSQQLVAPIKNLVRPQVASIVVSVAAPLNAIPVVGSIVYAAAVPIMTEWGTDYAARRVISEALKQCN